MDQSRSHSVLFFTQYFPPETGAAANRVEELTRRWADAGCDVTVVTSIPNYPEGEVYDGYTNDWHRIEERDGVTVHMVRAIPTSNAGLPRRAIKFLWFMLLSLVVGLRVSSSTDVVVATSPQPLTGLSAAAVSTVRRVPFVFDVRDLWPESITAAAGRFGTVLSVGVEAVVRLVYSSADRIVVVSRAFESEITERGISSGKIWYHPNGVDTSFITDLETATDLPEDVTAKLTDTFVVSYVGTIGRSHGLTSVIDAAQEIDEEEGYDDLLFVLVGYGADLDTLRERADQKGLSNVVFTGRKPKEMVPSILDASNVSLVHLKSRKLFELVIPSKMFESMAAGLPIVLGVRGEAERILGEADAGIAVEPESPSEVARAVRKLYDEGDRRQKLGENGADFVTESFDWQDIADNYREDLEQLLEMTR